MENALPAPANEQTPEIDEHEATIEPINELFIPQNPGDEPIDVQWFTLVRETDERGEEQGKGMYAAASFRSLDDLAGKLGGGDYWLTPRSPRGHLTGRARFFHRISEIDFPPKSLLSGREISNGGRGRLSRRGALSAVPAPVAVSHAAESPTEKIFAQLAQQRAEDQRQADADRREDRKANRELMIAMVAPIGTALAALITAYANRPPSTHTVAAPAPVDSKDIFLEGMAFANESRKAQEENAHKEEPIGETLKGVASLINAVKD